MTVLNKTALKTPYYSQHGQDKLIDDLLWRKEKGFFLEIGAHDGVSFSNTYFFEKERNWNGICIEPIPDIYKELEKNRHCIKLNCCVSEEDKTEEIFICADEKANMLSGLKKAYSQSQFKRLADEKANYSEIKVRSININKYLIKNDLKEIDYCSIDTEGHEFEILKTLDFNKLKIKAISVECNKKESLMRVYMKKSGYYLLTSIGGDGIFIKLSFFNLLHIFRIILREKYKRFRIYLSYLKNGFLSKL